MPVIKIIGYKGIYGKAIHEEVLPKYLPELKTKGGVG